MKNACHHLLKPTGLNNEAFNLPMITTICSTATTLFPKFTPQTAIVERSLRDIINQAAALAQHKELLSKEQWQDLTLQYKCTFVNNMLKFYRWRQRLSEKFGARLLATVEM